MAGGRIVGMSIIVLSIAIIFGSIQFNNHLEQQRTQEIAKLISLPDYANCRYDETTCPQAQEVALPSTSAIGLVVLGILVGLYLIRSDFTQRKILDELQVKRSQSTADERRELLLSVLMPDEQRVVRAVIEQPGISQATLRLRTDMSKAKLSTTLKTLAERGLIAKIEDGKTNTVHLKREL